MLCHLTTMRVAGGGDCCLREKVGYAAGRRETGREMDGPVVGWGSHAQNPYPAGDVSTAPHITALRLLRPRLPTGTPPPPFPLRPPGQTRHLRAQASTWAGVPVRPTKEPWYSARQSVTCGGRRPPPGGPTPRTRPSPAQNNNPGPRHRESQGEWSWSPLVHN